MRFIDRRHLDTRVLPEDVQHTLIQCQTAAQRYASGDYQPGDDELMTAALAMLAAADDWDLDLYAWPGSWTLASRDGAEHTLNVDMHLVDANTAPTRWVVTIDGHPVPLSGFATAVLLCHQQAVPTFDLIGILRYIAVEGATG